MGIGTGFAVLFAAAGVTAVVAVARLAKGLSLRLAKSEWKKLLQLMHGALRTVHTRQAAAAAREGSGGSGGHAPSPEAAEDGHGGDGHGGTTKRQRTPTSHGGASTPGATAAAATVAAAA